MEMLKHSSLKHISHALIIDGSESFYDKIPEECGFPVMVEYPFPIEAPSKNINNCKLKEFFKYTKGRKETKYVKREFKTMKDDILNQDFKTHAILPEFLINYIENEVTEEINYGFNIPYSYGTLEKFEDNNILCLIRPNIDNNLEICKPQLSGKKMILQWSSPDPIRSIKNMNKNHAKNFIIRDKNNIYLIDIDHEWKIKINLKLKCEIGYFDETLNRLNNFELAFMDTKTKLKLFNLNTQQVFSTYSRKDLCFDSSPRFLKMNYLTSNMLMIMTDKTLKILDNRCKDPPQDVEIKLHKCDMLLDFTLDESKDISNEVYLSSKHAFYIYDIRGTRVNDYVHHNLRTPPCFINYFQGSDLKFATLFGQSSKRSALFGTSSPYSLPYHLKTLEETASECRSRKALPVVPNIKKRLNYPITGVQIVPNGNDASIYFSNIFGEIFQQDVLHNNLQTERSFDKMHNWLVKIYETDDPVLNFVHLANARAAFNAETEFNDVDLFNHYGKSRVHEFLADEEFNYKNWDVEEYDEIWDDENDMERDFTLLKSEPEEHKVEEWIKNANFENQSDVED